MKIYIFSIILLWISVTTFIYKASHIELITITFTFLTFFSGIFILLLYTTDKMKREKEKANKEIQFLKKIIDLKTSLIELFANTQIKEKNLRLDLSILKETSFYNHQTDIINNLTYLCESLLKKIPYSEEFPTLAFFYHIISQDFEHEEISRKLAAYKILKDSAEKRGDFAHMILSYLTEGTADISQKEKTAYIFLKNEYKGNLEKNLRAKIDTTVSYKKEYTERRLKELIS